MTGTVCVLLSTCERYRDLAGFTAARLEEFWPSHPAVYLSGLESGERCLPLRDDPRNWMRVTRSACADLERLGYSMVYLVLDDHPPIGPCHAIHLNQTIPEMLFALGAVSVALSGWGQGRKRLGGAVSWKGFRLDLCPPRELWKYPLHPALWSLSALGGILDCLIRDLPENDHTPWAFERKGGAPDANIPLALKSKSYRIDGLEFAASPYPGPLRLLRFATDIFRFIVRKAGGPPARDAVDERLLGVHHYYHGPYPLIWSGLMRKGGVNLDALYFLKLAGKKQFLDQLSAAWPK